MFNRVAGSAFRREFVRRIFSSAVLTLLAFVATVANASVNTVSVLRNNGSAAGPNLVCIANGDQVSPRMVSDGNGGAIVTWVDGRGTDSDIYAQHVLAAGGVDPGWPADGRALCTAPGTQSNPRIVADGVGGAIVTWEDSRAGNDDIYAQRVLASGNLDPRWPADGRALCVAAEDQRSPVMAPDGSQGAIVAWVDRRNGAPGAQHDIYAQHVLASGAVDPAWPTDGRAVCSTAFDDEAGSRGGLATTSDGAGGAIVVWGDTRFRNDPDCGMFNYGSSIYAQHVLASGQIDTAWPAGGAGVGVGGCGSRGLGPTAVPDGTGGAVVLFRSWYSRFGETTILVGSVNTSGAPGSLTNLDLGFEGAIAPEDAGGAFVSWYSYAPEQGLHVIHVQASGERDPVWPRYGSFVGAGRHSAVAAEGLGGAIVAWEEGFPGGPSSEIYVQHVLGSGDVDPDCPPGGRDVSYGAGSGPQIIGDGLGGATVAWQGFGADRSWDIYAARLWGPQPTAVVATLVNADATAERARLEWYCSGGPSLSATIYRRPEPGTWEPIGIASPGGAGHLVFYDHAVTSGSSYGYRLGIVEDGHESFFGEAWLTIPVRTELALHGLQPNPAGSEVSAAFSLPDDGPAWLRLLDVSGRRVLEKQVGALGPGLHIVRLGDGPGLPAGLYFIQLIHGGRTLTARGVIVR